MRYWLSFDLGLRGSYDELFEWLDTNKARECGDFMATFVSSKTEETITSELSSIVNESARLYLIAFGKGGRFIKGKRKVPNWAGYGKGTEETGIEK